MKTVLVDTNVVLDVLLERRPFFQHSFAVVSSIEDGLVEGYLSAHALTTISYLVQKLHGASEARNVISSLIHVFRIAAVDQDVIHEAARATTPDFEDAVTASAAHAAGCDLIVTRDLTGFRGAKVRSVRPDDLFALL